MGKSSINGPFSMAMLNNQRVKKKDWLSKDCSIFWLWRFFGTSDPVRQRLKFADLSCIPFQPFPTNIGILITKKAQLVMACQGYHVGTPTRAQKTLHWLVDSFIPEKTHQPSTNHHVQTRFPFLLVKNRMSDDHASFPPMVTYYGPSFLNISIC